MPEDRYEIRLSGAGGQGIILAAVILAEAVGTYEGRHVCQSQSYGPEARGGRSRAEVIISDKPIDYPRVMKLDLLLAMNQASCDAYFYGFKPKGLLVVDSSLVTQVPTSRVIAIPFTRIAKETIGRPVVANMVALGAVGHLCGQVSIPNLKAALMERVPRGTKDINRKALQAGINEARKIKLSSLPHSIAPAEEEDL